MVVFQTIKVPASGIGMFAFDFCLESLPPFLASTPSSGLVSDLVLEIRLSIFPITVFYFTLLFSLSQFVAMYVLVTVFISITSTRLQASWSSDTVLFCCCCCFSFSFPPLNYQQHKSFSDFNVHKNFLGFFFSALLSYSWQMNLYLKCTSGWLDIHIHCTSPHLVN